MTPAQLTAWIEERRDRLERGEVADVGPMLIEPFYEVADLERWVRFTLREVDHWQALYYEERLHTARRLRELHKRLNGQPVTDEEIEREREYRAHNCMF